MVEQHADIV